MKIFLDDIRPAPKGWDLARSVREAINMVEGIPGSEQYEISLDYDLGMTADVCKTCNNRGWGRSDGPDYCPDCTHVIVSNDEAAPTGDAFLKWVFEMHMNYPDYDYLPTKIYLHTANPVGRQRMRWAVADLENNFGVWYPEAFQ